jgi:hypothetical protein
MAKQTNTPEDWRILAERDLTVADHLETPWFRFLLKSLFFIASRRRRNT